MPLTAAPESQCGMNAIPGAMGRKPRLPRAHTPAEQFPEAMQSLQDLATIRIRVSEPVTEADAQPERAFAAFQQAIAADRSDPARVFLPRDAGELEGHRGRFLLHVLGSSAAPETLALSPAQLRRKVGPTAAAALRGLYRRWSFVFVGFEVGDPDLALIAEGLELDSLDALQLSLAVKERYGVRIEGGPDARRAFASTAALADFILAGQTSAA